MALVAKIRMLSKKDAARKDDVTLRSLDAFRLQLFMQMPSPIRRSWVEIIDDMMSYQIALQKLTFMTAAPGNNTAQLLGPFARLLEASSLLQMQQAAAKLQSHFAPTATNDSTAVLLQKYVLETEREIYALVPTANTFRLMQLS